MSVGPGPGFGLRFTLPLVVGPALNSINTTMIAVALVPIGRATGASGSHVILLVAGLYLAGAVAQPIMGRLVDVLGARRIYAVGMGVAALAGLVPLLAPTLLGALISRIVIGIGTSAAYPAAMATIRDRSEQLGREAPRSLFAAVSISGLTSAAAGPVLGGILIEVFGWQGIFVVNAPYGVAAVILALLWMPRATPPPGRPRAPLDLTGMALFAVAVVAALVVVVDPEPGRLWLAGVALVAVGATAVWELRHRSPFLDLRMLAAHPGLLRSYARLLCVQSCTYLVLYGVLQWLQTAAGYSATEAGWIQTPAVILAGVGAAVAARVSGVRVPLVLAAALPLVGGIALLFLDSTAPYFALVVVIALFGPPQGLAAVANQAVLLRQAPMGRMGSVAGMSRTVVQIGAIVATSLIGRLFGSVGTDRELHLLALAILVLAAISVLLASLDRGLRPLGGPTSG